MTLRIARGGQPHHPHLYRCYAGLVFRVGRREFIAQVR
jgi:hypothetical protein